MVQFLQSMDLTCFSHLRGSVPAWTLNVPAHAQCFDKTFSLCCILANKSSVAYITYSDEYCTSLKMGNKAASFDQLIHYFAKYKKVNMIRYLNSKEQPEDVL